jgi:hypothetical protein
MRTARNVAFFFALLATALALGAALAHALELANKMALSQAEYFTVQKIYAGWDKLGFLLLVELIAIGAVIVMHRRDRFVFLASLAALAGLVVAQIIFWWFTFPANKATQNWTLQPDNWDLLRHQWEYSHLAGAAFQVWALSALIVAVLGRDRQLS